MTGHAARRMTACDTLPPNRHERSDEPGPHVLSFGHDVVGNVVVEPCPDLAPGRDAPFTEVPDQVVHQTSRLR
jgi:hypothetical protein